MAHTSTRVLITGRSAGWTEPVVGPDGEQLQAPIMGSGSPIKHPVWKHHLAQRDEVVDLPTHELERLADSVHVLEDQDARLSSAPATSWDILSTIFTANGATPQPGAPASAPVVPVATPDPVAPVDATEAAQAPAGDTTSAARPVAQGTNGWYLLPDGTKQRMSKAEADAWAPTAEGE